MFRFMGNAKQCIGLAKKFVWVFIRWYRKLNVLAYPIYLLPSLLMAQGFSSKAVPSFTNVPSFESTTEVLFESVIFYTHISIVSRVV